MSARRVGPVVLFWSVGAAVDHPPGWWAAIGVATTESPETIHGLLVAFGWDTQDPFSLIPRWRSWTMPGAPILRHGEGLAWLGCVVEQIWTNGEGGDDDEE